MKLEYIINPEQYARLLHISINIHTRSSLDTAIATLRCYQHAVGALVLIPLNTKSTSYPRRQTNSARTVDPDGWEGVEGR